MRRFDLSHCPGDQLCARIVQPTKAAARAEGANGARHAKGHCVQQLPKASYSKQTLELGIFSSLFMTKKSPRELCASTSSSLNLPAVVPGPHHSPADAGWGAPHIPRRGHFSSVAQLLAAFNTSWQLKTLSVHCLTTPRDLKMKHTEKSGFLTIQKTVHQIHALSFKSIFPEHLQRSQVNDITLDFLYRYAFENTKNVQQKCTLPGPK